MTNWRTPFQGTSYSSQNGYYATNHCVITPSIMNLQMYIDAQGGGVANGWVGAGVQPQNYYSALSGDGVHGILVQAALRIDSLYGSTGIGIGTSDANWPPELDYLEGGAANLHYLVGDSSEQFLLSGAAAAANQSTWHNWGVKLTPATLSFMIDGQVWDSTPNPSASDQGDAYGLCAPMLFGFNFQTGDPNNPSAPNPNVYQMQIDWMPIDELAS
jgi:hypothetical protein